MCSSFSIFLSENPFASFAILTAFYVFFFLILRNCVKKHPLFIEKKDNSLDVLIVHAPSIDRFGFYGYDEFTFVKKRKGKYRIKLSRLSMIFLLLSLVFFIGIYISIIYLFVDGGIINVPLFILLAIYTFLFFAGFFVWMHFSKVVSLIYFRKLLKKLKQPKRKR